MSAYDFPDFLDYVYSHPMYNTSSKLEEYKLSIQSIDDLPIPGRVVEKKKKLVTIRDYEGRRFKDDIS